MYVIVDKRNHCTAFKPKRSLWDNKYTDIQVSLWWTNQRLQEPSLQEAATRTLNLPEGRGDAREKKEGWRLEDSLIHCWRVHSSRQTLTFLRHRRLPEVKPESCSDGLTCFTASSTHLGSHAGAETGTESTSCWENVEFQSAPSPKIKKKFLVLYKNVENRRRHPALVTSFGPCPEPEALLYRASRPITSRKSSVIRKLNVDVIKRKSLKQETVLLK